jgi:hypothetical protein
MLASGVLVWFVAVVLIVCAFIVERRSIDRMLEKLSELPDQRYLLPLGPKGTLCAGSDDAGEDSDIALGGQRNSPRFTIHTNTCHAKWLPRRRGFAIFPSACWPGSCRGRAFELPSHRVAQHGLSASGALHPSQTCGGVAVDTRPAQCR